MAGNKEAELQVIFDLVAKSALIVMGSRTATIPFPVHSQREANVMGREFARNLGWLEKTK